MARQNSNLNPELPVSVSSRCINKDWFGMPMPEVWAIVEDFLIITERGFGLKIHSFVLMSNHFHLLVTAPNSNLHRAMQYFLSQTGRAITKSAGRVNHTWKAKYFRCQIATHPYFQCAYKYFYRNPVVAQICHRVEQYPYGTLSGLLGFTKLNIPVHDEVLFSDVEGTLEWLNTPTHPENYEAIKKALRRRKFKFPRKYKNGYKGFFES